MSELIELMLAPFVACLILVGLFAYLGIHIIAREVMMAGYDATGNLQREDDPTSDYVGLVYHANEIEIRADLDEDGIVVVNENGSTNPDHARHIANPRFQIRQILLHN